MGIITTSMTVSAANISVPTVKQNETINISADSWNSIYTDINALGDTKPSIGWVTGNKSYSGKIDTLKKGATAVSGNPITAEIFNNYYEGATGTADKVEKGQVITASIFKELFDALKGSSWTIEYQYEVPDE